MKKIKTNGFAMRIVLLFITMLMSAQAFADVPLVYTVDLNEEVDAKMWMQTRRAIAEAKEQKAALIVFHINTYGGAVDSADSIRTAILRLDIPTVAFVDTNAASAGSLITLACDSVYMAPGSSYGASSVVNATGEIMPDKYQSYMKSVMRSTAESHGKVRNEETGEMVWRRDPRIAEGFVTIDSVITLTTEEAVRIGYAEGVASNIDEVISHHIDGDYRVSKFEPTATDHILGFLASAGVRAILIMLIIGGIYMEMHTPGIGFAGGVAFVAAVLYFLPMAVAGTMAPWVIIVFMVGLILLALEIFVIPGFGVCGIAGIIAILAAIVGAMLHTDSFESTYAVDVLNAIVITVIGIVLAIGAVWFLTSKYGPRCVRRVSELQADQKVSEGYIGVDMSLAKYLGKEGIALTDLRPSGKILVEGEELDAVSLSGFISEKDEVKTVKFENAQLYVRRLHQLDD